MFEKFKSLLPKLLSPVVLWPLGLFTISLIIAIANFKGGVWLTGWDTLHPEFNFGLNIQRMLFGAWREDQGLGAVAAHSHMSDLPRIVMLWLFSWILPVESVKFVYVLLCLVLGPLGVYFFTTHSVFSKHKFAPLLGFTSGLLYLCNLGTVQHFYVVFEMFAVQYAAIGWLFWLATRFLKSGKTTVLFWFALVTLLSTPMAYASTLWFAFALGLALYLVLFSLLAKSKIYFFRTVVLGLILITINSFWLFPNLYFLLSGASKIPQESHINELFSSEAFLHNQAYGTLQNVALLKNFLFNWTQYEVATNTFSPLLQPWINHLKNPLVLLIGYSIFIFSVSGAVIAVRQKNKQLISVMAVTALSIFMVINANPPFEWFFTFLRDHSNLFEEGLRFPFTKFSILLMFSMSALAAQTLASALNIMHEKAIKIGQQPVLIASIISVLLCYYFLPAFSGNLINKKMKNDIPNEYFELFEWFKSQPAQARVAQLPLQTNTGWDYYSWNYEGPGFIWFGITQPLLVRDFDRWNPYNETFYNQASHALYSGTKDEFFSTLKQYGVHFILVDANIISPGQENYSLAYDKIEAFLEDSNTPVVWKEKALAVYDVSSITNPPDSNYTMVAETIPVISGSTMYNRVNPIYQENGAYLSASDDTLVDAEYPFADLSAERNIRATIDEQNIILERKLSSKAESQRLIIPPLSTKTPITTAFSVEYQDSTAVITFPPSLEININGEKFEYPIIEEQIIVPLEISPDELAIGFGSTLANVKKGEKTKFILTTLPSSPQLLVYYSDPNPPEGEEVRLHQYAVNSDIWASHFVEHELAFTPNSEENSITVTYPTKSVSLYLYDTSSTKNCAQDSMGEATQNNTENSVQLTASKKGAACKFLTLPQTTLNDSFLIQLTGENLNGRSFKFYIRNTITAHNELEHMLPTKQFRNVYSILRHSYATEHDSFYNPYALTIESRSFGARTSSNYLHDISLYPLPIEWLSKFKVINSDNPITQCQLINPVTTKRLSSAHYKASIAIQNNSQYIAFLKSYDQGWIAFPHSQPWQQLKHFTYNGWANAWEVPGGIKQVTILFWPQLLSTFGYWLAGLTIIALLPSLWNENILFTAYSIKSKSQIIIRKTRSLLLGKG